MIKRLIPLPARPTDSLFLWGPRQTGKSTLLRSLYRDAMLVDLLKTDDFSRYAGKPSSLREEVLATPRGSLVVIDEVQKIPALLDEVHWLIENHRAVFVLTGSSARKVKRGQANLLGGRAHRYELHGLVSKELGNGFDLARLLNRGFLPRHYLSGASSRALSAYVNDYLKEEIAAEGLVRNLPAFSSFLSAASLSDGGLVAYTTVARECGVSSATVKEYYQILVDTLLGRYLPAYTRRPKRRVIQAPKFYFGDVGVVNVLARRGALQAGGELFGKAFESWVFHELCAYREYRERTEELSYWRLASGIEVDFLFGDRLAVEAKGSRVQTKDLGGLRALATDHPSFRKRVVVSLDPRTRRTEDGIEILPHRVFAERLWADDLL